VAPPTIYAGPGVRSRSRRGSQPERRPDRGQQSRGGVGLVDRRRRVGRQDAHEVAASGQGKTNADIAGELYMSVATVKAHVTRLLSKLDVQNRVQIALLLNDADL
jgi:FixJ family two-component response regulator